MIYRGTSSDNVSKLTHVNYRQVDVETLEKNFVSKVRSKMENLLTSVETSVQDAVLIAIETLVIHRLELVMKSTIAPSARSGESIVFEPD